MTQILFELIYGGFSEMLLIFDEKLIAARCLACDCHSDNRLQFWILIHKEINNYTNYQRYSNGY